jgi:hypothetical protein
MAEMKSETSLQDRFESANFQEISAEIKPPSISGLAPTAPKLAMILRNLHSERKTGKSLGFGLGEDDFLCRLFARNSGEIEESSIGNRKFSMA